MRTDPIWCRSHMISPVQNLRSNMKITCLRLPKWYKCQDHPKKCWRIRCLSWSTNPHKLTSQYALLNISPSQNMSAEGRNKKNLTAAAAVSPWKISLTNCWIDRSDVGWCRNPPRFTNLNRTTGLGCSIHSGMFVWVWFNVMLLKFIWMWLGMSTIISMHKILHQLGRSLSLYPQGYQGSVYLNWCGIIFWGSTEPKQLKPVAAQSFWKCSFVRCPLANNISTKICQKKIWANYYNS